MTGYCADIPLECRTIQSFVWIFLLLSFITNISQCTYSYNLKKKYLILQERMPILNSLLEEVVTEAEYPMAPLPEATIVQEE